MEIIQKLAGIDRRRWRHFGPLGTRLALAIGIDGGNCATATVSCDYQAGNAKPPSAGAGEILELAANEGGAAIS